MPNTTLLPTTFLKKPEMHLKHLNETACSIYCMSNLADYCHALWTYRFSLWKMIVSHRTILQMCSLPPGLCLSRLHFWWISVSFHKVSRCFIGTSCFYSSVCHNLTNNVVSLLFSISRLPLWRILKSGLDTHQLSAIPVPTSQISVAMVECTKSRRLMNVQRDRKRLRARGDLKLGGGSEILTPSTWTRCIHFNDQPGASQMYKWNRAYRVTQGKFQIVLWVI